MVYEILFNGTCEIEANSIDEAENIFWEKINTDKSLSCDYSIMETYPQDTEPYGDIDYGYNKYIR